MPACRRSSSGCGRVSGQHLFDVRPKPGDDGRAPTCMLTARATTPAGTSKAVPTSDARRSRARTLASPRSSASNAPVSRVRPVTSSPLSFQTQCLVGPRKIVRAHRTELSIEVVQKSLKTILALSTSNRRTDEARDRCRPAPLNSMTNRVNLCVRETHRYLPSHTRIMLEERPG